MTDARELAETFADRGVVRIDGAFSGDEAAAMREVVWRHAETVAGIKVDAPATWPTEWVPINWQRPKRSPVFNPVIDNGPVTSALDAIFGAGGWKRPKDGAQILVSFPTPRPWVLPDGWHMDTGFERPAFPVPAVKLFACFDRVDPEGGGTMLLPGVHRVVDEYRKSLPPGTGGGMKHWREFLRHDPWLADLLCGHSLPEHGRAMVGTSHDVDGVPVEVMEVTGEPGDLLITHINVFHTPSPNIMGRPRQMLGKAVMASQTA